MRFINFSYEVENGYINVDKITNCYLQPVTGGYNIKITCSVDSKENYRNINPQPLEYKKAIKLQNLLLTYLANDMVKVIDIDENGNITPRFYV